MNREQIIQMAAEAGLSKVEDCCGVPNKFCSNDRWKGNLAVFATIVASAEREACAKVADTISDKYGWGYYGNEVDTADEIASAIRARGLEQDRKCKHCTDGCPACDARRQPNVLP